MVSLPCRQEFVQALRVAHRVRFRCSPLTFCAILVPTTRESGAPGATVLRAVSFLTRTDHPCTTSLTCPRRGLSPETTAVPAFSIDPQFLCDLCALCVSAVLFPKPGHALIRPCKYYQKPPFSASPHELKTEDRQLKTPRLPSSMHAPTLRLQRMAYGLRLPPLRPDNKGAPIRGAHK